METPPRRAYTTYIQQSRIQFEWNEAKRRRNLAKHGVDFLDVLPAFDGRPTLEGRDARRDYGETRWVRLAEVEGVVFHIYAAPPVRPIDLSEEGSRRERETYYR